MNDVQAGFINEIEKVAFISAIKAGLKRAPQFTRELKQPFGKSRPWKDLTKWQKGRVAGGVVLNVGFGAEAGKSLLAKKPSEKKFQEMTTKLRAKERARQLYYGS